MQEIREAIRAGRYEQFRREFHAQRCDLGDEIQPAVPSGRGQED
jgi:queuine/archaeosine tRNA-ribosyltransferase